MMDIHDLGISTIAGLSRNHDHGATINLS